MLPELLCEPEFGVVDFPVGVVGLSSFLLLVDGVLELDEPPLLGLDTHTDRHGPQSPAVIRVRAEGKQKKERQDNT